MLAGEEVDGPSDQLVSFVNTLCALRKKAIAGRLSSGIEADWLEDEEFYQGVDDANRAFNRSWVASIKRGIPVKQEPSAGRSTVFLNITRPYVDAAAARVADMLLPVDDRCWDLKPTPIPDLTPEQIASVEAELQQQVVDLAQAEQETACKAADEMEKEIDDLLVECNWHGEVRMMIEDAARIGTGVLKGPFPIKKVSKVYQNDQTGQPQLTLKEEIQGASKRIDPWNFFPDEACGENIHNGSGTWERDYLTGKQLMEMATAVGSDGQPLYITSAILDCMREGPQKYATSRDAGDATYVPVDDQFQMWTFYGVVKASDMRAAGTAPMSPDGQQMDDSDQVNVMAILVNDRLIKIATNVLDTGEYPYDVLAWQRRPGVPWGMGVARHSRTPQRMLNAATRMMMDNAGDSAGMQIVIGEGMTPADGQMEVRGRKTWLAEAGIDDVRKRFYSWSPESKQPELQAIIDFALRMGEQTTGMPLLLQGQQGEATDTLGGMQLLQNNASGVMRRLAKRFDDYITDPHIRRYYNWQMQYGKNQEAKGDFQIDVRASSALVERDMQKQFLMGNALSFSQNPIYGLDPRRVMAEVVKSERMDPKRLQYTDEEYAQLMAKVDPVAQSVAALNDAKAKQATATAATTTVTGLFEATQAANLVATNPAIAPAADAIALSAGVVDSDAPPLIPAVEAPPLAPNTVPENTHPNFPATGAVGAQAGIEGGGV